LDICTRYWKALKILNDLSVALLEVVGCTLALQNLSSKDPNGRTLRSALRSYLWDVITIGDSGPEKNTLRTSVLWVFWTARVSCMWFL
jgi:hypothetical protein